MDKEDAIAAADVALDFQGLLRSALIGKISGARELWGMSDGREGSRLFYKQAAKVDRARTPSIAI